MKLLSCAKPVAVAALLVPYAMAMAQGLGIADLISGKGRPATLQVQDLPEGYRAVRIVSSGPAPDPMSGMLPLMMVGVPGQAGGPNLELMGLIDESWTDGTVDVVEGQRFLVTYRLDMSAADFLRRSGQSNPEGPLSPTPKLKLRLVRVDGIQSLSPNPEVTKERVLELLGQGPGKTIFDQAHEAAARTTTLSNIKQVGLATMMYTNDYDDVFPYAQGTKAVQYVTYPYLKSIDVWSTKNPNGGEFRFNLALGGVSETALDSPAETVMFYESNEWPDGRRVVAFADGHAKVVSQEEWKRYSGTLTKKYAKTAKRPLPLNYGMNWKPGNPLSGGG